MAISLIACGIDIKKTILFNQSRVITYFFYKEHN